MIRVMNLNSSNSLNQAQLDSGIDLIDLKKLLNTFKRNKILIISITSIATSCSILYSLFKVPTWKGEFQIVVEQKNNASSTSAKLNSLNSLQTLANFSSGQSSAIKTQEEILSSPLVLSSVYDFVKESKRNSSNNINSLNFKEWKKNFLKVEFKEETNVLNISFIDQDKELILRTLEMISRKYQEYSKRDRDKSINNGIKYLEIQENLIKEKSNKSIKKLNKFSIDNGLGDIDGFVKLDSNLVDSRQDLNSSLKDLLTTQFNNKEAISNSGAGQRYATQFAMLEKLEAQYLNLSSKLKNNSKTLINLRSQINKLSKSLKRPNEILLEFRVLKRIASRDENMLKDIESRLLALKLEKVRKESPWELISKPTLQDKRVSPKRKNIVVSTFILSILLSYVISKIKEFKSDNIYELDFLKENLGFKYIGSFYKNNIFLNDTFLNKLIGVLKQKKINIIYLNNDSFFNKDNSSLDRLFTNNSQINYLSNESLKDLEDTSKIIVVAESFQTSKKTFNEINEYLKIFENQILGWINIADENR